MTPLTTWPLNEPFNSKKYKKYGVEHCSINLSYRITLELLIQDRQIIPVNVGDHDAVYLFAINIEANNAVMVRA